MERFNRELLSSESRSHDTLFFLKSAAPFGVE